MWLVNIKKLKKEVTKCPFVDLKWRIKRKLMKWKMV